MVASIAKLASAAFFCVSQSARVTPHSYEVENAAASDIETLDEVESSSSLLDLNSTESNTWFWSRRRGAPAGPAAPRWGCTTNKMLPREIAAADRKGLAVDDPTFSDCADELIGTWPHTDGTPVKRIRLFAAWKKEFERHPYHGNREQTWTELVNYVHGHNVQVLMGVEIKCTEDDDWMWDLTLQLLQRLGKDHVMGVGIGNELDNVENNEHCWNHGLWGHNNLIHRFRQRVQDLDRIGFNDVKVMTIWAMGVLGANGDDFNPSFTSFLSGLYNEMPDRFVFAFNPYPIWDANLIPTSHADCQGKVAGATTRIDYTRAVITEARKRVTRFTGNPNANLWITESGWSSPSINVQRGIDSFCPQWSSEESYWNFFKHIMEWDLELEDGVKGADYLFFFTMRDARGEAFGLVPHCGDTACKIQQ